MFFSWLNKGPSGLTLWQSATGHPTLWKPRAWDTLKNYSAVPPQDKKQLLTIDLFTHTSTAKTFLTKSNHSWCWVQFCTDGNLIPISSGMYSKLGLCCIITIANFMFFQNFIKNGRTNIKNIEASETEGERSKSGTSLQQKTDALCTKFQSYIKIICLCAKTLLSGLEQVTF